jgi:hypothetical protein
VRLGSEISPTLKITIVREEDFARYMEQRAAQAAAGETAETAEPEAVAVAELDEQPAAEVTTEADDTQAAE